MNLSRRELDANIVNIELTLASIIQGVALYFLTDNARTSLSLTNWPSLLYLSAGLCVICIFWSRSIIHTLTLIKWPLEFGHNFLKTILRLAATRDELRVVGDQRGCPTSTRNLADAILAIAPRLAARDTVWGTYHFAGTGVTTWHGFASRIVSAQAPLTGRKPPVTAITTAEYPTAARRPANSELDCGTFASRKAFATGSGSPAASAGVSADQSRKVLKYRDMSAIISTRS